MMIFIYRVEHWKTGNDPRTLESDHKARKCLNLEYFQQGVRTQEFLKKPNKRIKIGYKSLDYLKSMIVDQAGFERAGLVVRAYFLAPLLSEDQVILFSSLKADQTKDVWPCRPSVMNKHKPFPIAEKVYCGRPSIWGNPFPVESAPLHVKNARNWSCEEFDAYLINNQPLIKRARLKLRNLSLECWCFPSRCHCNTLIRVANCRAFIPNLFLRLLPENPDRILSN